MAVINGTSSSETLNGTTGDDHISGGAGTDTLIYSGKAAGYRFDLNNGLLTATDINAADGDDGTDQLIDIEQLQFSDRSLNVLLGGETQISAASNQSSTPALTVLADGGWLVTWESQYDGNGRAILTQRYDTTGQIIGEETVVGPASDEISASTTALPDGGWLVAWLNNESVLTQRYDSNGLPDGDATQVYDAAMNWRSTSASVTTLPEGGWLVTWRSGEIGQNSNIYTQRYDVQGSPISSPTQVNTTPGYESAAATVALPDGGWLVTYGNRLGDLFFQRYDKTGDPQGEETRVNSTYIENEHAAVNLLPDGGWVIAWEGPFGELGSDGITMQRYDAQGEPTGAAIQTLHNMGNPQLVTLSDGGWLLIAEYNGVYIKRYDASGQVVGNAIQANPLSATYESHPIATALPDGGWLLAYQSGNSSLSYKRYDAQGIEQTLTIQGTDEDDVLNAGTAGITLAGGAGNDLYVIGIDGVSDSVVGVLGSDGKIHYDAPDIHELSGDGIDTVYSYLGGYTLPDNVENGRILTNLPSDGMMGGTRGGSLNGNSLDNVLFANDGDNLLSGGDGSDTASYAYSSKAVTIALDMYMSATGGSGYDTLSSIENLVGSNYGDTLLGNAGDNILDGGLGNDTLSYANATGSITANLAVSVAQATGAAGLDTLISIENLIGSSYSDTLTGNAGNNVLNGGQGNDVLNGGAGTDTLIGGDGSDIYYVDNAADVVSETNANISSGGSDTVYSYLAGYTLSSNIENGRILAAGAANLTGNSLNNVLYAGAGNNLLNGAAGVDTASYAFAASAVNVSLAITSAQATGGSGSDTLSAIENLNGSNFNDTLTGNASNNALNGGQGNDVLNGGAGADTLTGGDGSDIYYVDNTGDVVNETNATASSGGLDTVYSYLTGYTLGNNVENGRILATGAANLTGNSLNNILYAGAGNNLLNGAAGVDTASYLYASAGVTASLAITTAQATGGSGSDTLSAIENLSGSNFNDKLTGNSGNNTLDGGTGADTLSGGDGSDTYYVDNAADVVSETNSNISSGGNDTVYSYLAGYTLGNNVENGRILSAGAANLTGNSLNNILYAGAGNNLLNGAAGVDTASYAFAASAVTVSLAITAAQATGGSGSDTLSAIENLNGSNFSDTLTGNAGNNALNGGQGNDVLDGGAGADTLTGGDGSDIYYVDNAADVVSENNADISSGGNDTVYSYLAGYTLGNNIENGRALSAGAANLTGNSLNNILYAGAGNNLFNGAAGVDTASYLYANAGVTVSLAITTAQATSGSGSDTLSAIENLSGSNFNDTLTGDTTNNTLAGGLGDDTLSGGLGNDVLDGGAGADSLIGGDGADIYYVDNIGDLVSEANSSNSGIDTVYSYLTSYMLADNVENGRVLSINSADLTGNDQDNVLHAAAGNNRLDGAAGMDTASYAYAESAVTVSLAKSGAQATGGSGTDTLVNIENLTGSKYNDTLIGNSADNVLIGGAGADTMIGGNGSDTYYIDNIGDAVIENTMSTSGGGIDTVFSSLSYYTLANYVENAVIATGSYGDIFGNSLDNVIYAGSGDNYIYGDYGTDTVSYAFASSAVTVNLDISSPQATGGSGTDTLYEVENLTGSDYNDKLSGNFFSNRLEGGKGNDTLNGAGGSDVLIGGAGNDVFAFSSLSEMGLTNDTWDSISDFVRGADKIDLSKLDANTAVSGNNAFNSIIDGAAAFTAAGQLKLFNGVLYGNTDGDNAAEFAIQLIGVSSVSLADFIA